MFKCDICDKQFDNIRKLNGHKTAHRQNFIVYCCCIVTREVMKTSNFHKHLNMLRPCDVCGTIFKRTQSGKQYCSRSCATTITNKKRGKRSADTKEKIASTLRSRHKPKICQQKTDKRPRKRKKPLIDKHPCGPFTKVYISNCKHCNQIMVLRNKRKYCDNCAHLYAEPNRNKYKFTFNIYQYPDLFDLQMLQTLGWFSPGGKSKRLNPNGLVRDHKVSVNEAILHNYDCFYIKHPLNCELMTQDINNRKKTKSSITYSELVRLVDDYEMKKATNVAF